MLLYFSSSFNCQMAKPSAFVAVGKAVLIVLLSILLALVIRSGQSSSRSDEGLVKDPEHSVSQDDTKTGGIDNYNIPFQEVRP